MAEEMAGKKAEKKYYKIISRHTADILFNLDIYDGSVKSNEYILIKGSPPKPNPVTMIPGVSYLNNAEKEALDKEAAFVEFIEKKALFSVHEINFKDMPEEIQQKYDTELFKKNLPPQA